ncbi:SH3 domain-containing protein [Mesorhizobium sp. NPDC059054]|uniref:SH3 domain-containing protein n=1 Tax=Mesorhizobium sp. NPDC059054 TaxID=3346711 RepID=UPI0036A7EB02
MTEIESGDVMHMRDASFSELLDEINSKARQTRMSAAFFWIALVVGVIAGLATGGPGLFLCVAALPAGAIGSWLDSYRRTTVLYYDLEGDAETAYARLVEGFDGLVGCAAKWHIEAGGAVQSLTAWKRNAGASHLVNRKGTTLAYNLPAIIKSNVTPPALHVGRQVMFFMPDIVLMQDGSRVGAVNYIDLNVRWQNSRFIETERVPRDAQIVDHTWKHPNKNGGPDRRFRDNRQIPICLYETMHLTSNSGVNELVEFSRTGLVAAFVDGCRKLAALPRERTVALPLEPANNAVDVVPITTTERKRSPLKVALLTVLGVLVGIPVLAVVFGSGRKEADTGLPPPLSVERSDTASAAENRAAPTEEIDPAPAHQVTAVAATDPAQTEPVAKREVGEPAIRYTKTMVNLREGPGTKFAVITVVPKGVNVAVLESKGVWCRVKVDENTTGWMANSTIAER